MRGKLATSILLAIVLSGLLGPVVSSAEEVPGVAISASSKVIVSGQEALLTATAQATTPVSQTDTVYFVKFVGDQASLIGTATAASGAATFTVAPTQKTVYGAVWGGSGDIEDASGVSSANRVTVAVKAKLGAPVLASSVVPLGGKKIRVRGTIAPRHSTGARSVTLYYQQLKSGSWKTQFVYKPINKIQASGQTTYEMYLWSDARGDKGSWRVRSKHSDSQHATSYSSYTYFSIR